MERKTCVCRWNFSFRYMVCGRAVSLRRTASRRVQLAPACSLALRLTGQMPQALSYEKILMGAYAVFAMDVVDDLEDLFGILKALPPAHFGCCRSL